MNQKTRPPYGIKRGKCITVRLTPEEEHELKALSIETGRTVSSLVREIIEELIIAYYENQR